MGLFDNLFKPKSPPSEENSVETGANPAEPAKHSDVAARPATADRPDPSAFLHPKSFVPRGVSPLAAPGKPGAPSGVRKPGPPPPPARDEIVLTLGDVLSRIPTPYLKQGNHDPKRELRFSINDLSSDIARGRAAVPLSRIAQLVPDIFVKQITRDEDTEIRLPLQKLVEQIGLLRSRPGGEKGRQAAGATTLTLPGPYPLQMTDTAAPARETLRGLMSVVEPVFELKSTETAELLAPLEEEPPIELKPAAEPLIVQFPLAAGTPEVETPPDLVEEDTTTPEREVAEPVPSPAKEVAAAPRVEETPVKVSESFEALVARLERESAAKFSESAAAHAEAPPAVAKETTLPAAESLVPTVESTSPPTEHAVDAKPDQPLAEAAAPKVEPGPSRGEDRSPVAEAILSKAEAALVEPLPPVARPAASVAEPTTPAAENAAPSTTAPTLPLEAAATESKTVPAPIEAAAANPVATMPAAESSGSAFAPETLSVPAPLPAGEALPPAVPIGETIGKPEMAAEAPSAPAGERMLAPGGMKVQEKPVIKVRESTEPTEAGGEKIQLSLAAILRQCPREIMVGDMPHVPDSVRITLPFAPIDRQLVQGHVEISAVRFVAAIPFIYQKHFSARMGVKVPIPLEEVFQNLPSAATAEPAAPGPAGQILAPAFPEENALAAVENLPPMPEVIELAPAPAGVAPAKAMEPTGIESVMAMLKAETPPPFQRATESPKGVEMPPLESAAETPKAVEPATGERVGPKPVEAATLEIARPAPVEPPPVQRAGETPQGVTLPSVGNATEVPKADKPAPIDRTTEAAKPAEPLPVEIAGIEPMATEPPPAESATEAPKAVKPAPADRTTEDARLEEPQPVESAKIEPRTSEPPPIESATETPKAITPARIKKAGEKPKATKPARTQGVLATPETVQAPPVESASLIAMTTEPPPAEGTGAAPPGDGERRPTESAMGASPHAEAPPRVEETPSLPVSSETPPMAAPPGASPMEPTAPEPAPAPLDLPAFHQFTPPPPLIVSEVVEPAAITAIGSAEPKAATPDAPHLVPVPAANESGRLSEGAVQAAETLPSAVGPEAMAATRAPESKAPATGPEPHKVEGESVPSVASMLPESESSVRLPEPVGQAGAPEIAVPPVEMEKDEKGTKDGKDTQDEAESKTLEEVPAGSGEAPSMSVFAEATQTIRPPQMVRPFIVLPPPIIGFTPGVEKAEEGLQPAENKATESNITLGAKEIVSLDGEAPSSSPILSPEVPSAPSMPFVTEGPVEEVGPTEQPAASSSIIDIDFTQALVPPAESIPANLFPAAVVEIGLQTPGPISEAAGGPVAEVIPSASEQAPAIPVAERPAGITFVVQGRFAEPLPPVAEESAKRSDAGRAVEPRAKEGASEIEAAPPIGPAPEVALEGEGAMVGALGATPAESGEGLVEAAGAGASEQPKMFESESEPLLHIPQIAAALEAATEILPPAIPLRRFDQDALQAIFMTEETLDLAKISRLAAQLPGVHACVIATRDQACTGGTLPEGFDLAALLGLAPRVNEAAGRMPIGDLKHFTLYGERYSISFFARHGLSLCAVHRPRSFVPGVREKLVAIADELSK